MENLHSRILENEYFSNDTKARLLSTLDAVNIKDVQQQAIDFLNLNADRVSEYKSSTVKILAFLATGHNKSVMNDYELDKAIEMLIGLNYMFDALDCKDYAILSRVRDLCDFAYLQKDKGDSLSKGIVNDYNIALQRHNV